MLFRRPAIIGFGTTCTLCTGSKNKKRKSLVLAHATYVDFKVTFNQTHAVLRDDVGLPRPLRGPLQRSINLCISLLSLLVRSP